MSDKASRNPSGPHDIGELVTPIDRSAGEQDEFDPRILAAIAGGHCVQDTNDCYLNEWDQLMAQLGDNVP